MTCGAIYDTIYSMDIRNEINRVIKDSEISIRQLSIQSGVRRQSIMQFLAGGNIHIDNLQKMAAFFGYELSLAKKDVIFGKRIKIKMPQLGQFCKDNGISSVSLFGSVLRSDFRKDSDIDVMIKIKKPITFFELADIENGIKKIFGTRHKLDIVTEEGVSPLIRSEIERTKEVIYDEAA